MRSWNSTQLGGAWRPTLLWTPVVWGSTQSTATQATATTAGLERRTRRSLAAVLLLLIAVLTSRASYADQVIDPDHDRLVNRVEQTPIRNARLPRNARFFDHTDREIELGSLFESGKPSALVLVYFECPMICGIITENLQEAIAGLEWNLGDHYQVIIVSIDPGDQPTLAAARRELILERYGRGNSGDGLHVLTASDDAPVRELANAIGYGYEWIEEAQEYAHTSAVYLITPEGRLANYHGGSEFTSYDLKYSLMDAANGKVGTVWDKINFLCVYWDPVSGRWAPAAKIVMASGGVMTLGALVMIVWIAQRSRRKRNNGSLPLEGPVVGVES